MLDTRNLRLPQCLSTLTILKIFYCYILHCLKDGNFYIGYTENLKKRFEQHSGGEVKATKPRRPLKLVYYSAFENKYDALDAERYFKSSAGQRRIKEMLKNFIKCKNTSNPPKDETLVLIQTPEKQQERQW